MLAVWSWLLSQIQVYVSSNCLSCRVAFALPAWQMVLEVITEIMCLPAHGHVFTRCTLFTQDCLFLKEICTFWRALHNWGEQKLSKPKLPIVRPRISHSQKTHFTFNESSLRSVSLCFFWVYFNSTHPLNYLTVGHSTLPWFSGSTSDQPVF